ncbi:MAG: GGDEF domain-containing protein [Lachnospiraceae bacterium]|nr:GGDEF domain-containing protein [Lachnospiraceae bacterium]
MKRKDFCEACRELAASLINAYISEDMLLLQTYAPLLSDNFTFLAEYSGLSPLTKSAFLNRQPSHCFPTLSVYADSFSAAMPDSKTCIVSGHFAARRFSCVCHKKRLQKPVVSILHLSIPYVSEWEAERQKDSLTGLFNRHYTEELISRSLRHSTSPYALFMLDLDDFKMVNDTLGHPSGDMILQKIASLLSECFGEQDIIGRIGGDEFLVFTSNPDLVSHSEKAAEKIIASIRSLMKAYQLEQSCSVGIVCGSSPLPFSGLYETVDCMLYRAKRTGKARYSIQSNL